MLWMYPSPSICSWLIVLHKTHFILLGNTPQTSDVVHSLALVMDKFADKFAGNNSLILIPVLNGILQSTKFPHQLVWRENCFLDHPTFRVFFNLMGLTSHFIWFCDTNALTHEPENHTFISIYQKKVKMKKLITQPLRIIVTYIWNINSTLNIYHTFSSTWWPFQIENLI